MNITEMQKSNLSKAKELFAEVEKLCFNTEGDSILANLYTYEQAEKQEQVEREHAQSLGRPVKVSENDILKRVYISEAWSKVSQLHNTISDVVGLIEEIEGLT